MGIRLRNHSIACFLLLSVLPSCRLVESARRVVEQTDRSATRVSRIVDPDRWARLAYGSFEPSRWPSHFRFERRVADLSNMGARLGASLDESARRLRRVITPVDWRANLVSPLRRLADSNRWRALFRGSLVDATDPRRRTTVDAPRPRGYFARILDRIHL